VYRRQNPTATGAILFLFYKNGAFNVKPEAKGVLANDPSNNVSVAYVLSDEKYIENVEGVWMQSKHSIREMDVTMTCSDEVYVAGSNTGSSNGSSNSGGSFSGGGGNCNAQCCLSCNMAGCPNCCC